MGRQGYYVGGSWYRVCDRTGFVVRSYGTQKEWTNHIVREQSWEPRNAQDFVKGVPDDQRVSDARPDSTPTFQGPLQTYLTAAAAAGATVITVFTTTRWLNGDTISFPITNGFYQGTVTNVLSPTTMQISPKLPNGAVVNTIVTDVSAVSNPSIG